MLFAFYFSPNIYGTELLIRNALRLWKVEEMLEKKVGEGVSSETGKGKGC